MPIRQSEYREFTGSTEVSPANFNVFIHVPMCMSSSSGKYAHITAAAATEAEKQQPHILLFFSLFTCAHARTYIGLLNIPNGMSDLHTMQYAASQMNHIKIATLKYEDEDEDDGDDDILDTFRYGCYNINLSIFRTCCIWS